MMKLYKTKKDPELYYYFNTKGIKLWCFRHRYYDPLGKRREKYKQGYKSENEAYRGLLEVKTSILNGEVKQVKNSNLTISEWLDIWYETHKNEWKISSRSQRENAIKYQMKPLLGKYKLAELDKSTYKRVYINELLKKYKPSTVQLFHRLFKIAINAAVDDELIPRNRFNKITIPNEEKTVENFFTAEELNEFIAAAKKYENITNYSIILLLSFTGLRKGEALGLQWKNINFENKTLTVERTRDNKGTRTPKTKNSFRTILIDDTLINQLKVYKTWCKKTKLSFGLHLHDDDFIFISYQSGTPITDNPLMYSFQRILKHTTLKKITPHGLRHTHATLLISQRIPVKVIADRLGNTPQMIFDIYGHSFKELEEESVAAFSTSLLAAGGTFGEDF
ncbi:TPA: tyrosine-type recombinase/integrase [Bacillus cereus]|nr:tyrosine-type recombinase/integrase [Bacillus thuringiensis]HDR4903672.1 tyrosine-type recombinase/integrase [Bacillus cereus]